VVIRYTIRTPLKTLPGRAVGLFILDENHKIKEYWLHEWNQMMINWVFRGSWVATPVTSFLKKRKQA
jgi:hypothetical protein